MSILHLIGKVENLYYKGEKGIYPCGCKFEKVTYGFIHYVDPRCAFDKHKVGLRYKGYEYKAKEA